MLRLQLNELKDRTRYDDIHRLMEQYSVRFAVRSLLREAHSLLGSWTDKTKDGKEGDEKGVLALSRSQSQTLAVILEGGFPDDQSLAGVNTPGKLLSPSQRYGTMPRTPGSGQLQRSC